MRKANKFLIGLLLVLIPFIIFNRQQSAYPTAWNEIHLGMSKQEVYSRVGLPITDLGDIKGGFWVHDKLTQNHVLWVYFENGKVTNLNITRYIGTSQHFFDQVIYSEHSPG